MSLARPREKFDAVQRFAKQGAITEAIVADGQDETLVQRRLVGGTAESFQHSEAVLRKVVALDGLDISPTLLVGGFLAGLFQSRNFVKAERQGAR